MKVISLKWVVAAVLVISMLIIAFWVHVFSRSEEGRSAYNSQVLKVISLNAELKRTLGYGGMIHDFKNCVLRPSEPEYCSSAQRDADHALRTMDQIDLLSNEVGLELEYDQIRYTTRQYRTAIEQVLDMHSAGLSISEIDSAVRIDDSVALASLVRINERVIETSEVMATEHAARDRQNSFVLLLFAVAVIGGMFFIAIRNNERQRRLQAESAAKKLRETNTKLERASAAKSQFLANMSHELRTPLNGILGMAQLLTKTKMTEQQERFCSVILSSGNGLLSLLSNVLDMAKVESGMLQIETAPFNLRTCLDDSRNVVLGVAESKSIQVMIRWDERIQHSVLGDETRIRQILINLIGNAAKFMETGKIVVSVHKLKNSQIMFCVKDEGPGISADQQEGIFNRFQQADNSATRKHGGTGLGLAICKEFVTLMGGTIGVESDIGKGAAFWFVLPMKAAGASLGDEILDSPSRQSASVA